MFAWLFSGLAWLSAFWLVLAPVDVAAQPSAGTDAAPHQADRAGRLQAARAHFVLGMERYNTGDFREALREFQLVVEVAPSAELWFNMARAHQELAEYDRAARAYQRYLQDRVDAKDAAEVRALIADLERLAAEQRARSVSAPDAGSLRIHNRSQHALILLDGRKLEASSLAEPLLVPVGRHRLDASAPEHIPLHAQIDVAAGLLTAAYVDLTPARQARMVDAGHGTSWVLLGLAGAGLVTSVVFATLAVDRQSNADTGPARAWAVRTDVALLGTGVCALAAAVVYLIEARSARTLLSHARAVR